MAKVDWNTGDYEAGGSYETLPVGRYLTVVHDTEMKQTKAKTGHYIEVEFAVIRPEKYKGRKLWARLNVKNPSEEAQRIGREQFNGLCEASQLDPEKVDDTLKLHGKVQVCIVDIEEGTKGPMNRVTGWLKPSTNDQKSGAEAAKKLEKEKSSEKKVEKRDPPAAPADLDDDDIPF